MAIEIKNEKKGPFLKGQLKINSSDDEDFRRDLTQDMSEFEASTEILTCNGAMSSSSNYFKWPSDIVNSGKHLSRSRRVSYKLI